jgi:hypothetical protein
MDGMAMVLLKFFGWGLMFFSMILLGHDLMGYFGTGRNHASALSLESVWAGGHDFRTGVAYRWGPVVGYVLSFLFGLWAFAVFLGLGLFFAWLGGERRGFFVRKGWSR